MAYTIRETRRGHSTTTEFAILDDGLTAEYCKTREQAEQRIAELDRDAAICEFIDDALLVLRNNLVSKFGLTPETAKKHIAAAV